jgi:hypothetical protein
MATAPFPVDNDFETLSRIVSFIARFLRWLLEHEQFFTYSDDIGVLRDGYEASVGEPAKLISLQLRDPSSRQRERLEAAGLTGLPLRIKALLLLFDVSRGRIKRIINRINSLLGSLSTAFPPAEIIKEFKDQTEASMGDLEDSEGPQPLEI